MSWAVVRGESTAAQRFLDDRLRVVTAGTAGDSAETGGDCAVTLPRLLYHCMRTRPDNVHMINGATGQSFTNAQILRRSVSLAHALRTRHASGTAILCVMRNREELVTLYYGAMLAGVAPCLLDPASTHSELSHFLPLISPRLVVCDTDCREVVSASLRSYTGGLTVEEDLWTHDQLERIAAEYDDDLDSFQPTPVAKDAVCVLLPTSGSTGLAKAAEITHDALMTQLPSIWCQHTRFPRPTSRAMFLSTAQWMTFTNLVTSCPAYEVTLVMSPDKTLPTVLRVIETHKPTWLLLVPGTAAALAAAASSTQLSSLRDVIVTGAPPSPAALARLQLLVPAAAVRDSYGMTEAQGFVAIGEGSAPAGSVGPVFNIFEYKLVDENEKEVTRGEKGELYLRSPCIIKRYLNNAAAYAECAAAGGWWRSGDLFAEDEGGNLYFSERKKFWFKYLNYQISPEELELVISAVPGVQECVVCESARGGGGAAAAVVRAAGASVTRDDIVKAVDASVMEYKRLRGGVAFVTSLPRTRSGKLHRALCAAMLARLLPAAGTAADDSTVVAQCLGT